MEPNDWSDISLNASSKLSMKNRLQFCSSQLQSNVLYQPPLEFSFQIIYINLNAIQIFIGANQLHDFSLLVLCSLLLLRS